MVLVVDLPRKGGIPRFCQHPGLGDCRAFGDGDSQVVGSGHLPLAVVCQKRVVETKVQVPNRPQLQGEKRPWLTFRWSCECLVMDGRRKATTSSFLQCAVESERGRAQERSPVSTAFSQSSLNPNTSSDKGVPEPAYERQDLGCGFSLVSNTSCVSTAMGNLGNKTRPLQNTSRDWIDEHSETHGLTSQIIGKLQLPPPLTVTTTADEQQLGRPVSTVRHYLL